MQPSRLALDSLLLTLAWLLTLASPGRASDGVREINQACAVQAGCFAGDASAFPVTIASPGSYVLTSNLVVPDEDTTAIVVSAPSVSIDLNGFEIVRSGCENAISTCIPASGVGHGIAISSLLLPDVVVHGGSVRGVGGTGIWLGDKSRIYDVRVRWNRLNGLIAGAGSTLTGNVALENGFQGIAGSDGSTISGNIAAYNGSSGIVASGSGANVSGNSAVLNWVHGIVVGAGSLVSDNTASFNGEFGITADAGSAVSGNTARLNGLRGIQLMTGSTYRENTVTDNLVGAVFGGVNRGDNYCVGPGVVSANCP